MLATPSYTNVRSQNAGTFGIQIGHYSREVQALIDVARAKTYNVPSEYTLRSIDFYIKESKANGTWYKRDLLYLFGQGDITGWGEDPRSYTMDTNTAGRESFTHLYQFKFLNLKNPELYEAVPSLGSGYYPLITRYGLCKYPAFTTASYTRIAFNLSTNATYYTLNDASFTTYCANQYDGLISSDVSAGIYAQITDGTNICRFNPYNGTSLRNGVINGTAFANYGTPTTNVGLHHFQRTASNALEWFVNGVSVQARTTASSAIPNQANIDLSTRMTNTISMFALGSSLTTTQITQDYQAFLRYKNRVHF